MSYVAIWQRDEAPHGRGGGRGVAAARGSWCWLLALPADSADGRDDVAAAAAAVAAARKML